MVCAHQTSDRDLGSIIIFFRWPYLRADQPCIASILTGDLPYWPVNVPHAAVVVGMEKNFVYLNDPAFVEAPVRVGRGDFDLAWLAHGEMFAAICK